MKTLRLLTALAVVLVASHSHQVTAQCSETLDLVTTLDASATDEAGIVLVGDLTNVTVNLTYTGGGGSYPADMLVYIYDPNGNCVVWGGWNVPPTGTCTNLGTGNGGAWPTSWSSTLSGDYTATFDVSEAALTGEGEWIVVVQNGWATGATVTYDLEFIFDGLCAGDCPDPEACNYAPDGLNPNEDACWYAEETFGVGYNCEGICINDEDGDEVCDEVDPCIGEYDECGVCNGPGAIYECGCNDIPETDCDCAGNQLDALGVCGGTCAADEDGDGLCDACIEPEGFWLEVETVTEHVGGELDGMTTYRVNLVCSSISDYLYSVSGSALSPLILNSTSGTWWNHPSNDSWNPSGLDLALTDTEPLLIYDSYLTIGSDNSDQGPFPGAVWSAGDPRPEFEPGEGNNVVVNSGNGLHYLLFPGMGQLNTHPGFAGDDFRILVMQMTTMGDIQGQMNVQVYPNGELSNAVTMLLEYDSSSLCYDLDPCVGEYDECGVCAGPGAVYECGCTGPEEGFCDCEGNVADAIGECGGTCEADVDMDGICDTEEIPGCDDAEACNYEEGATDNDGSCVYAETYYDCDGACLSDTDMDGVCDELEIAGCLDEMACNYNPEATDDSGMCTYPEEFLDCNGDCMNDINDNDICDELEAFGCVDELACNYDAEAAFDDGSCEYPEAYYDCEGECLNDADGDGVCDELEIVGCMQLEACNWNEDATEPDDSCEFPGDACDDGDDTTVNDVINVDCDCVGEVDRVDEFTRWGIALFPTPVRDVMHVQFRGQAQGVATLVIQNATGQIIRVDQIQGDVTMDISALSDGVYFVSVEGLWGAATRRIVLAGGR